MQIGQAEALRRVKRASIPHCRPCERREAPGFENATHPIVTAHSCSARALIVDHDLGFLMWLGELFAELGCQAVPAFNCRQALALIERFDLSLTILVINPEL